MHLSNYVPLGFFVLVIGVFVFRFVKYGGIKASFFGARIRNTVGEFQLKQSGALTTTMRVHLLEGSAGGQNIGLEVSQKAIGGFSVRFFRFSREETGKLVRLLDEAARESS
jgi:hypothetical protein